MTHRRNIQTSTNSGDFDNNWQGHTGNKTETFPVQKNVPDVVINKHKGRKSRIYGLVDSYQVEWRPLKFYLQLFWQVITH